MLKITLKVLKITLEVLMVWKIVEFRGFEEDERYLKQKNHEIPFKKIDFGHFSSQRFTNQLQKIWVLSDLWVELWNFRGLVSSRDTLVRQSQKSLFKIEKFDNLTI